MGIFEPTFRLPGYAFLISFHSNIFITGCYFLGLTAPSIEYALVKITSLYGVARETVFTTAKRPNKQFYSNETTIIRDSVFIKGSYLLFNSPNINYILGIYNCVFEELNLVLHEKNSFIDLMAEGPLIFKNLTFKSISSEASLLAARPYLNLTISNLILEKISVKSCDLFYIYSISVSDKSEHQVNISYVFANEIYLNTTPETYGKVSVSLLYIISLESGKGPAVTLINIKLSNVFHNKPHLKHYALRIDNCVLFARNISGVNISNSTFFGHNPRTATSDLQVDSLSFLNDPLFSIIRLLECGVSYFTRAELTNSDVFAPNITFNVAVSFSLAQSLFLSTITFKLGLDTGTLLFAQVTSLKKLFIRRMDLTSILGGSAALFTLATEQQEPGVKWDYSETLQKELLSGMYKAFGITDSKFDSALGGAFILLMRSEMLFQGCSFNNNKGAEGNIARLTQEGIALFFSCNISNSYSEGLGGSFFLEGSRIIIINSHLMNSKSGLRGGAIYALDSRIFIRNSSLVNTSSGIGGAIFADGCISEVFGSIFNISLAEKYGGHIVAKQGVANFSGSSFHWGKSLDLGGSAFLENAFLNFTNLFYYRCESRVGNLYIINGDLSSISSLRESRFVECICSSSGAIIYSSDINLMISGVIISGSNTSKGFLFELVGLFLYPLIYVEDAQIINNIATKGLFYLQEVFLNIRSSVFTKNNILKTSFITVEKSKVTFTNIFFNSVLSDNLYQSQFQPLKFFIKAKRSYVNVFGCVFELSRSIGFLSALECPLIFSLTSCFNQGKGAKGGVFSLQLSTFSAESSIIGESLASQGGGIYSIESSVILKACLMINNIANLEGSDLFLLGLYESSGSSNVLRLEKVSFSKVSKISVVVFELYIFISESWFEGSLSGECGLLRANNVGLVSMTSSIFYNFFNNSVVTSLQTNGNTTFLAVAACKFIKTVALLTNGAFISASGDNRLFITNSQFESGNAKNGGAIYLSCQSGGCQTIILSTNFSQNLALESGGAISSESPKLFSFNNNFVNNTAFIGENINFYPTNLKMVAPKTNQELSRDAILSCVLEELLTEMCYVLKDLDTIIAVPGYNFSLGFVIIDRNMNIQYNEDKGIAVIAQNNEKALPAGAQFVFSNNIAKIEEGVGIFKELLITGHTNSALISQISYKRGKIKIVKEIKVLIKGCNLGDSFLEGSCKPCSERFFSLKYVDDNSKNQSCDRCPANSFCPGGYVVIPNERYWRKNGNSSKVIKCKKKNACPLQRIDEIQIEGLNYKFRCSEGYEGNLCDACSHGFGLLNNQCVACKESQVGFILLIISGFLIYLGYIYTQETRSMMNSNDNDIALMKIMLNHTSIFIMLLALKIDWSDLFKDFITIISSYASTTPSSIFSFDCLLELSANEQISHRLIIAGLSPFILGLCTFIMNIFIYFLTTRRVLKKTQQPVGGILSYLGLHFRAKWMLWETLKHLILIFLNIYPQILLQMFKVFGCLSLDDSRTLFLAQNPWVTCYSDDHNYFWRISVFFILLWGCGFPVLIILLLIKLKSNTANTKTSSGSWFTNSETEVISQTEINATGSYEVQMIETSKQSINVFLTEGYKEQFYWWEMTVFARKLLFLAIATFSEEMDNMSIGALTILLLTFFLLITLIYKPFTAAQYVVLEVLSLLVSIISISMGLILSYEQEIGRNLISSCIAILLVSNFAFIVFWVLLFSKKIAKVILPRMSRRLESLKSRMKSSNNRTSIRRLSKVKIFPK